jgi:hypothetical protein
MKIRETKYICSCWRSCNILSTGLFGVGEALLHEFVEDRLPDAQASEEERAVSMLGLVLGIPRK